MATYWVDNVSGNNGWPGSEAQPWQTIFYAVSTASGGDTIKLKNTGTVWSDSVNVPNTDWSSNPITITADDPDNPPTLDECILRFRLGGAGWIVDGLVWNGSTTRACIEMGIDPTCSLIIVQNCTFEHGNYAGGMVRFGDATDCYVIDCHFRDIRSRVAATDRSAIRFEPGDSSTRITISGCTFEDIGSDPILVTDTHTGTDILIEDCAFGINRPYSASGTSWYNGDTTTWQDFSTNVGENGIDIKGDSDVLIRRCVVFGYRTTVSGQDCDGSVGEAIVVHQDATQTVIEDCVLYDCNWGTNIEVGGGYTYVAANVSGCFVHRCLSQAISVQDGNQGIILQSNASVSNLIRCLRISDGVINDISNNIFYEGVTQRQGAPSGESNFNDNVWYDVTPDSQWVDAGDKTLAEIFATGAFDGSGNFAITFDSGVITIPAVAFEYHPDIDILWEDINKLLSESVEAQGLPDLIVTIPSHRRSSAQISILVYKPTITSYTPRGQYITSLAEQIDGYQHSIEAMGGYDSASFSINDRQSNVEDWIQDGLGRHIEVYDESSVLIWVGFVNRIKASLGPLALTRGPLMDVANRVNLTYSTVDTSTNPPTVGQRERVGVTSDTDSQARYGILETYLSSGGSTDTEATEARNNYLAERALPKTTQSLTIGRSSDPAVQLECLGYVYWLEKYVYNQTASSGTQNLSAKISAILAADPNSLFGTAQITTNTIQVQQYENDDKTAWDVIKSLVAMGDAADNRYLFGVYGGQVPIYEVAPTDIEYYQRLADPEQRIEFEGGERVFPWNVRPGRWLLFSDLLVGRIGQSSLRTDPRAMFIESVSYTAPWGLSLKGGDADKLSQKLAKMGLAGIGG